MKPLLGSKLRIGAVRGSLTCSVPTGLFPACSPMTVPTIEYPPLLLLPLQSPKPVFFLVFLLL